MIPEGERSDATPEQPILWLGVSGFTPQQRAILEAALVRPAGLPHWRIGSFGDADAWWVNGGKVRLMPDGNLKVAAGLPTEHALNLNLSDIDRPVAFATPLAAEEFEPMCTFDPASQASMHAMLLQFDNWLWLVRAQFVLGAQIIRRGPELRHGVYHVSHRGKLLAVLDFQHAQAGLCPRVHPAHLWAARWDKRPSGAGGRPESFLQMTPGQLAWTYVRRNERNALPERYRTLTIYYRHVPGVPLRWLRDSQLILLRELSAEPATLQELCQRTGLVARQVEQDLACLYYAGSITTTRDKAAEPNLARRDSQPNASGPSSESLVGGDWHSAQQYGLTAPVQLDHP